MTLADPPGPADNGDEKLDDQAELLFRQVHPSWIVDGEPSSQAFRPTKKDEGMLSVTRGSMATAEDAYRHHVEDLKLQSGGSWAVTVGEASSVDLDSFAQPLANSPAHGFIDFRGLGRGATEARAKALRADASARGCLYSP